MFFLPINHFFPVPITALILRCFFTLPVPVHSNFFAPLTSLSFADTVTAKVAFLADMIVIKKISFGTLSSTNAIFFRWAVLNHILQTTFLTRLATFYPTAVGVWYICLALNTFYFGAVWNPATTLWGQSLTSSTLKTSFTRRRSSRISGVKEFIFWYLWTTPYWGLSIGRYLQWW